jgi:hypothetical protein
MNWNQRLVLTACCTVAMPVLTLSLFKDERNIEAALEVGLVIGGWID